MSAGGFFISIAGATRSDMLYDAKCQKCKRTSEVSKPMAADFPRCAHCGGQQVRAFNTAPAVHYAAPGFYSTDVSHFQKQVGTVRFARFEAQKAATLKRAATGRLTPNELALERTHARYAKRPLG